MAKMTRRRKTIEEKVDYERTYAISEAVTLLNEISGPKFSESLDISVNLGIDPQKSDQTVRGATSLPHGSGKETRVAVFAQADSADEAQKAGADIVGFEHAAESDEDRALVTAALAALTLDIDCWTLLDSTDSIQLSGYWIPRELDD